MITMPTVEMVVIVLVVLRQGGAVLVTRLSVTIWRAEKGQGGAALQQTGIESSKIRSAPSNAMVAPFLLLSSASVVAAQALPLASPPAAMKAAMA